MGELLQSRIMGENNHKLFFAPVSLPLISRPPTRVLSMPPELLNSLIGAVVILFILLVLGNKIERATVSEELGALLNYFQVFLWDKIG